MPAPNHQPDLSRRASLKAGTMSLLGALAGASPAPVTAAGNSRPAKNCILVYLLGGPPHLDMWDMKPDGPSAIRGEFRPIATSQSGIAVCEHLPRLAKQAQRFALLRSLSYANNDHPFMTYYTLTGRISSVPLGANTVLPPSRSDDPHMGAVVSRFRHKKPTVPGYVAIPEVRVRMSPASVAGGGRAGFLGPRYDPLAINEDPRKPMPLLNRPAGVTGTRYRSRQKLLTVLDGSSLSSPRTRDYEQTRNSAFRLTRDGSRGHLLELEAEPARLRDAYGRNRFGQSLLLARRLVQRGVSFVGVHFNYMSKCDGWDTHKQNFKCLKGELLPMLDRGLSALLDDLANRAMLKETLVVVMGEFGRTPKINRNAGRDHWGQCGSALFAGGGVQGGNIVGQSDRSGAFPVRGRVAPPDVVATIYHALGLDPHHTMRDRLERPLALSTGKVIRPLF